MKTLTTTILLSLLTLCTIQAQKYGHINSNLVLTSLPEVKAADAELESYYKQLEQQSIDMKKKAQEEYEAYSLKASNGELSELQMKQGEEALQKKGAEIQQFDLEAQQKLAEKKQEVYQPILDKVQKIISEVGKEKGYTMIFDSSSGGMLFVEESEDIMPFVKQRLGI